MVSWIRLPPGTNGEKVGLDDFLVSLSREGLDQEQIHERLFSLAEPIETLLDELRVSSWREKDLRPVLSGTVKRIEPDVCTRDDDVCLFYQERVNSLFGESTEGKTWVALFACKQEIEKGNHAVYLDFEDDEFGITERLRAMGVKNETILEFFHYVTPDTPFDDDARAEVLDMVFEHEPTLVVIDSTGESMALDGVRTNVDEDVSQWNRRFPKKIARLGPAVLLLDHVTKDPSTRRGSASGSHRKKDMINGSSFEVVGKKEFGRGQWGEARLITRKDRLGAHVRNKPAGTFVLDARSSAYDVSLDAPDPQDEPTVFRPSGIMEKMSRTLEKTKELTQNVLYSQVPGKKATKDLARELLVLDEYVVTRDGPRRAIYYRSKKPYREAEDPKLSPDYVEDGDDGEDF